MRVQKFIERCTLAGIVFIWGEGNTLIVDYPDELEGSELLDEIRFYKQEIIGLMQYMNRATICKCGATETQAVPIHEGRSTRLDYAKCGRFMRWGIWNPNGEGKQNSRAY